MPRLLDVKIVFKGGKWIATGRLPHSQCIFIGTGKTEVEASGKLIKDMKTVYKGLKKYFSYD